MENETTFKAKEKELGEIKTQANNHKEINPDPFAQMKLLEEVMGESIAVKTDVMQQLQSFVDKNSVDGINIETEDKKEKEEEEDKKEGEVQKEEEVEEKDDWGKEGTEEEWMQQVEDNVMEELFNPWEEDIIIKKEEEVPKEEDPQEWYEEIEEDEEDEEEINLNVVREQNQDEIRIRKIDGDLGATQEDYKPSVPLNDLIREHDEVRIENEARVTWRAGLGAAWLDEVARKDAYREGHPVLNAEMRRFMRDWNEFAPYINRATEELQRYERELRTLFDTGRLSAVQVIDRIDAINRVWRELRGDNDILQEAVEREALQKYEDARENINRLRADATNEYDEKTSMRHHINGLGMGKEQGLLGDENALDLDEIQLDQVHAADKWLLTACMKEKGGMENSIVFQFLNRPESERLLAYSLIERGYPKELTPSEILLFNRDYYKPNLDKIIKNGFKASEFERVYQQVCQAGKVMNGLHKIDHADEANRDLKTKKDDVTKALEELKKKQDDYNEANWFTRRFKLKSQVEEAVLNVCKALGAFLETSVRIPGEEDSKLMDYVKNGMMTATGVKTAGGGLGTAFGIAKGSVGWAGTAQAATGIATNVLGSVLGCVSFVTAVLGIVMSYKNFTKLSKMAQAGLALDWINQVAISPSSAVASSVTGAMFAAGAAGQTAVAATAGVGVVAGLIGTAVGGYKFVNAAIEGEKGVRAREKLNAAYEKKWETPDYGSSVMNEILLHPRYILGPSEEDKQQNRFENDIFKIQERIKDRETHTAGHQVLGGLCAMAACACLLQQNYIMATAFGVAGLGIAVYSLVTSRKRKKEEYTKAIDDYLNLDEMVRKRLGDIQEKIRTLPEKEQKEKTSELLSRKAQKRIRDQLRKDMMALMGYTSEKSMYLDIMQSYADYIYQKLNPVMKYVPTMDLIPDEIDEAEPFIELVKSLGLKYDARKGLPTNQMIFAKLTS